MSRKTHLSLLIRSIFDEKELTVFLGKTREGFLKEVAKYSIISTHDGLDFKAMKKETDISSMGLDVRVLAILTHYLGEAPEYINNYWTQSSRAMLHIEVEPGPSFKFIDTLIWRDFKEVEKLALDMSCGKKSKNERLKIGSAYVTIK